MIAPALPPQLDGIGDYAARVAVELAKDARVTILTGDDAPHAPIAGCEIAPTWTPQNPATVRNLLPPIEADKPDWVLLQYNPFSYGPRGWNPHLPGVMAEIKKRSPRTRVAVMAHETFVPYKTAVWMVMGTYQRWQFYRLGRAADLLFLSIEPWAKQFARWFPKTPVRHLPVGSNIGRAEIDREAARQRLGVRPETFVLGLFGQAHLSRMLDWVGEAARAVREDHADTLLLYVGPHAANVRAVSGDVPLLAEGPFPPDEVSRRFAAMDLYLVPFIDGVSTRRTSFMTGLLHGVPTVSTRGFHTDSVLLEGDGKAYRLTPIGDRDAFVQAVRSLRGDAAARGELGAAGERLYREKFTYESIVRQMRAEFERTARP